MGVGRVRREFRRESFACSRDWVHFIVEFELAPCSSCRSRARIRPGAPAGWRCSRCSGSSGGSAERGSLRRPELPAPLPLHPDLWLALLDGGETATDCPLCRERVPLSRCWISPDARRLYCASHLRPISAGDRLRRADLFLAGAPGAESPEPVAALTREEGRLPAAAAPRPQSGGSGGPEGRGGDLRLLRLAAHLRGERCAHCPYNGAAVYDGERLVEIETDRRRCTTAPDALNCAGIDH